jgi:hypothetical protein
MTDETQNDLPEVSQLFATETPDILKGTCPMCGAEFVMSALIVLEEPRFVQRVRCYECDGLFKISAKIPPPPWRVKGK